MGQQHGPMRRTSGREFYSHGHEKPGAAEEVWPSHKTPFRVASAYEFLPPFDGKSGGSDLNSAGALAGHASLGS